MVFPWFSPGFPMAFPHRGAAATVSSTPGGSAPLSPDRGTAPADHRWIRGTRGTPWGSMGWNSGWFSYDSILFTGSCDLGDPLFLLSFFSASTCSGKWKWLEIVTQWSFWSFGWSWSPLLTILVAPLHFCSAALAWQLRHGRNMTKHLPWSPGWRPDVEHKIVWSRDNQNGPFQIHLTNGYWSKQVKTLAPSEPQNSW